MNLSSQSFQAPVKTQQKDRRMMERQKREGRLQLPHAAALLSINFQSMHDEEAVILLCRHAPASQAESHSEVAAEKPANDVSAEDLLSEEAVHDDPLKMGPQGEGLTSASNDMHVNCHRIPLYPAYLLLPPIQRHDVALLPKKIH